MAIIDKVKTALRVSTTAYDDEIQDLIDAAQIDLQIAGVIVPVSLDAIVTRAIITYCKMSFGIPDDYDRLKSSYDEQKAQLMTATGWADWGGI